MNIYNSTNYLRYLKSRIHRLFTFNIVSIRKAYERFRNLKKLGYTADQLASKAYIFYTIHQPDEAQTIIRGYHNISEIELIRIICYNLTSSVSLVVKLHPRVEYTYSNAFMKELTQIPNLVLAKSGEDSLALARNSLCVLTISSSIWMECLLENIPCFTFGRGAFDAFDNYPYSVGIDTLTNVIKLPPSGLRRDLRFDENLVNSIYQNSFAHERNAFSLDAHIRLGDAIFYLCSKMKTDRR